MAGAKARQQDITQPVLLEFVRRDLLILPKSAPCPSPHLCAGDLFWRRFWPQKISANTANKASGERYQETLFGAQAAVETSFTFEFDFTPTGYAPHWIYVGHPYQFPEALLCRRGELENKGEEYECAKALDRTGKVKHWVRNLERRGFSLPLAKGKFYPDFVAELTDGRILVAGTQGQGLCDERRQQRKMQRRRALGRKEWRQGAVLNDRD